MRQVILDARSIPDLDVTAAEQVKAMIDRLRARKIEVVVVEAHLPLRQAAERLGLRDAGSASQFHTKLTDAVAEFERASVE